MHSRGPLWTRAVREKQKCFFTLPKRSVVPLFLHSVILHLFIMECLWCARHVLDSEDIVGAWSLPSKRTEETKRRLLHKGGFSARGVTVCYGSPQGSPHPRSQFKKNGEGAPRSTQGSEGGGVAEVLWRAIQGLLTQAPSALCQAWAGTEICPTLAWNAQF